jgi:hypothetical protein
MNAVKKLLGESRQERWCFTEYELGNPEALKACRGEDEFVASAYDEEGNRLELGVLVYRDGRATNRWEDGTAGVPEEVQREAEVDESPSKPIGRGSGSPRLGDDDLIADNWRDVEVAEDGSFTIVPGGSRRYVNPGGRPY